MLLHLELGPGLFINYMEKIALYRFPILWCTSWICMFLWLWLWQAWCCRWIRLLHSLWWKWKPNLWWRLAEFYLWNTWWIIYNISILSVNYFYLQYSGFAYFGAQFSRQCYCGTSYDKHGAADESDCDMVCLGNANQTCGARWRNSVYKIHGMSRHC